MKYYFKLSLICTIILSIAEDIKFYKKYLGGSLFNLHSNEYINIVVIT